MTNENEVWHSASDVLMEKIVNKQDLGWHELRQIENSLKLTEAYSQIVARGIDGLPSPFNLKYTMHKDGDLKKKNPDKREIET